MPNHPLSRLLLSLEESKGRFGRGEASKVEKLLAALTRRRFADGESLIRFHESLLFLRAFPPGPDVVSRTEKLLETFHQRVEQLRAAGADFSAFDTFEAAGIAGTVMQDTLSFDVIRWLARRIPRDIEIDWDDYEEERAMGATWPRFMPLLDEDAFVEANIPWLRWLREAKGTDKELGWLIRRFEQMPISDREKAELYDSLRLPVRWRLQNPKLSRTRNWLRPRSRYYHTEPLIPRSHVDLSHELSQPGPLLKKLPLRQGRAIVEMMRELMAVRYRDLYGSTLNDPRSVMRAQIGRGVIIHLWNPPPDRRLPLRAYVCGFTLKNGVPINYFEAIGLCEWMEVGFYTFYSFRAGETGWIYSQILRCVLRHTGAKCISVYPYQIGQGNDEAIESGAFWFYRKLGFRPGPPELLRLTEREERRIERDPAHKSSARILKRLAQGHMFYELPGSEKRAWDRFSTRNLGLQVNRRMAREFGGDSLQIQEESVTAVSRALGAHTTRWNLLERQAFENWAPVLALIPDLAAWNPAQKRDLVSILRAKSGRSEMQYLRLTQKHFRLRQELLRLGSRT
ncbi:MAG: hypothetical protein WB952_15040 [Terriglobales bacterium]